MQQVVVHGDLAATEVNWIRRVSVNELAGRHDSFLVSVYNDLVDGRRRKQIGKNENACGKAASATQDNSQQ